VSRTPVIHGLYSYVQIAGVQDNRNCKFSVSRAPGISIAGVPDTDEMQIAGVPDTCEMRIAGVPDTGEM